MELRFEVGIDLRQLVPVARRHMVVLSDAVHGD
jgi:hypothetical protein